MLQKIEICGKYTKANIMASSFQEEIIPDIIKTCNLKVFENEKIVVMPDCHPGKGCVVGFTSTYKDALVPNMIGVDQGCGMCISDITDAFNKDNIEIVLESIDSFIRDKIPHGFNVNKSFNDIKPYVKNLGLIEEIINISSIIGDSDKYNYHIKSLGSLGGGNHFIEISNDSNGRVYLIIHSGSRNFGLKTAKYFQKLAVEYCRSKSLSLNNKEKYSVHKELCFLEDDILKDYEYVHNIAVQFAETNREIISKRIHNHLNINTDCKHIIHNYIDTDNKIIRKGAISAKKDELVLIPINMRDGSIIGYGKGNNEWNNSAPHGAGRITSRKKAKELISLDDFEKSMVGIYSTSINKNTIDESPMAYKSIDDILECVVDTIEITDILKPIYNFKSS